MKSVRPIFRQDYDRGFIIFTKSDGSFISDGISWFESLEESSQWYPSHVLLAISETKGIEAAEKGVEYCNLFKYFDDPHSQVVCREPIDLDDYTAWQAMIYGMTLVNKKTPYDYTGLLGYGLKIISGFDKWIPFLRKLPVPLHLPGSRFCSAAVADEYKHTKYRDYEFKGMRLLKEYHVTRISPVMLQEWFPLKDFRFDKKR